MTKQLKFKKDQEFWCLHPKMPKPLRGKIIALTSSPFKPIGMEFEEKDKDNAFHNCDGRGGINRCLWVKPNHLLSDEEYSNYKKESDERLKDEGEDVEELDFTSTSSSIS